MSTLPKEPEQPITAEQVKAWLHTIQRKCLALHVQATAPWNSLPQQQAFMEMSNLLQEALEEVRVISTMLREDSQALRAHTAGVWEHAAQLRARPHRMTNTALHYREIRGERLYLIEYNEQQFFTPCPDSHHDTLRLHSALVQGEVSYSRCISSYCTTGWHLPPFLCLSIIVTCIDMNNRATRPLFSTRLGP